MSVDAHRRAEELMVLADVARAEGRQDDAIRLFREAAEHELVALKHIPETRPRTRGIIAVSAVSLLREAAEFAEAVRQAASMVGRANLPSFAEA